jgi:carbon monoxide dehydrogenase subunit G
MEHQVIIPFPVQRVRAALQQPDRLVRCVPGFQSDAGSADGPELRGRLKLRIGGSTITYRGVLRIAEEQVPDVDGDDHVVLLAANGEGEEARGGGSAKLTAAARLEPAEDAEWATSLTVHATVAGHGRIAEADADALAAAGHRLLDRFITAVVEELAAEEAEAQAVRGDSGDSGGAADDEQFDDDELDDDELDDEDGTPLIQVPDSPAGLRADGSYPAALEFEMLPPEDAEGDIESELEADEDDGSEALDLPFPSEEFFESADAPDPDELAESAANAAPETTGWPGAPAHRRTIIGRSAEEVDHAPPRGRYAPVPVPVMAGAGRDWRWAAVGAVGVIAASVVAYRVLRRR